MYGRANNSWSRLENLSNASFPFVQSCSDTHQQHKGAAPHREEPSSKLTPSGPGFSASVLPGEPPGAARFLRTVGWCNGNTSGPYPGECGFDSRPCMRHLTGCASRSPAGARSVPVVGMPSTDDWTPSRGCTSDGGLFFRVSAAPIRFKQDNQRKTSCPVARRRVEVSESSFDLLHIAVVRRPPAGPVGVRLGATRVSPPLFFVQLGEVSVRFRQPYPEIRGFHPEA